MDRLRRFHLIAICSIHDIARAWDLTTHRQARSFAQFSMIVHSSPTLYLLKALGISVARAIGFYPWGQRAEVAS
ncbi:MAG: hypothetical protein JOY71_09500 [Acetobacteraceae bacterium]|nr:hypothetical protein [Acetobacteraceae bacterium]MBV8522344.1 hypothetical protein [Acetobacteraceae bacterium]MBV8590360.1 hypothetical protein [Acetobacteraceae bacterium]